MKSRGMPEQALAPAHDPMMDETPGRTLWRAISNWALAIALVLGFVVLDGWLNELDRQEEVKQYRENLDRKSGEISRLQHQLGVQQAAGACTTLFYLVEGDDMEAAGEKLLKASLQLSSLTNEVLYPTPLPPLKLPRR